MTSSYLFLTTYSCSAYEGATGTLLWTEKTGYQTPRAGFIPGLGSTLFGSQLFVPHIAGRVLVRDYPDSATGHNSAAVDPVTKSVTANSENGKHYRWDLTTNPTFERIALSGGIGEATLRR
jgi:hypothetical protein